LARQDAGRRVHDLSRVRFARKRPAGRGDTPGRAPAFARKGYFPGMERYRDILDAQERAEGDYVPQYATFWERLGAYVIDSVVVGVPLWILSFVVGLMLGASGESATLGIGVLYLVLLLAVIAYYPLMESSRHRATIGKMALRLQVVDERGGRITTGQAFGRFFGKILSGAILYIGFLMVLWDDRKQGLHDKLANTYVTRR
jgi:uncharacterized RDD family membrane protein YckC